MDSQAFYDELMNEVRARAELEHDFTESSFVNELNDRLVDAEVIGSLTPVHFAGRGLKGSRLAVSAYEMDDTDDSCVLVTAHFEDGSQIGTLTEAEARRQFTGLERYISESLSGTFQAGREESAEEYDLAERLRTHSRSVTRYRLYLLTNKSLSSRAKDFPSTSLNGTPVEYHVWDIDRLHRVFESSIGREELTIDLTEWLPEGAPALHAEGSNPATTSTFLLVLPARMIVDLYGRYGSRLLEGNVRSYLSNRGKVNRGIRETVLSRPDRFLAYNNGITATATAVQLRGSAITSLTNLQIVNGGQTTASLFYTQRESRNSKQFDEVHVQAKLVVVSPDLAQELVPDISRFANSQNKVNEADFFSNSPFHVRLEELSRRILTPPRAGVTYQSKWFYERVRGQYANERTKSGSASEEKKFSATFPRSQVITKTDAAKYLVSWERKPHLVSAGAQKCFVAFATEAAKTWDSSNEEINETYFKHLVAKAILYQSLRGAVAEASWYQSGYLANVVTYTIGKVADIISRAGQGEFDFDLVWLHQGLSQPTLEFALRIAHHVLAVLVSEERPIANVTEWAKREQCWTTVQKMDITLPQNVADELVAPTEARSSKRAAKVQQRVDGGIQVQAAALQVTREEWTAIQTFAKERGLLSPIEAGILEIVTRNPPGIPSERQAGRLMDLRRRVAANGYDYERATDALESPRQA